MHEQKDTLSEIWPAWKTKVHQTTLSVKDIVHKNGTEHSPFLTNPEGDHVIKLE